MKKFLTFIFILIVLGVACVITCPDREAHMETLMSDYNARLDKETGHLFNNELAAAIGATVGSRLIENALDKRLEVKNCFVFSLGRMMYEHDPETVTMGILGHVFIIDNEKFRETVDKIAL